MMTPDTCSLILLRHGATENNLCTPPRLQGQGVDVALCPVGKAQAEQTSRFLASQPISAVYSSPLLRAKQTAEPIAQPHGLEVRIVEALIECDVGAWEGCSWPEIEREEPEAYRRFVADPYQHGYRGGENFQQVHDRVVPALADLAKRHLGRQIVVVGHNTVNRVYLGKLLHMPREKRRRVPQENCGINVIRYHNEQAKVVTLNALFHLSPNGE